MGSIISSSMAETFKKNQEKIQETQRRNLEKQMALQLARSRDFFMWFSAFSATAAVGLLNGYRKTRRPGLIAPLVPLTFVTAYYWDLAYGDKVHRIRREAESILSIERDLLQMPSDDQTTVETGYLPNRAGPRPTGRAGWLSRSIPADSDRKIPADSDRKIPADSERKIPADSDRKIPADANKTPK